MAHHISLETFFLKEDAGLLTRSEYKRVMLTGYLSIACIIVAVVYASIDILGRVYYSLPGYLLLFSSAVLVFVLIRQQKYSLAKIMLMANANLVVFYAAINDPISTGTYMLFIPAGTGSFAVFGFQERSKTILMAIFSVALFVIAFFGNIHIEHAPPSNTYVTISFIFNLIISLAIVVSIFYLLGNLNETSERELREKEKSEREKNDLLHKINAELDQFVYSVSHDLRSPLSSIQGLADIGKISTDTEEMKKCFSLIEDRVKAQYFFINEIIEIYRNNRAELRPESINLKNLVNDVVQETSFESGARDIQFKIDISENLIIETDKIRLRSILFNLIGNSIKYHDASKPMQFINVGSTKSDSSIEIFVEDNGRGIPAEHLSKIFDMFYRASEDSRGSGLGLYIVKEMATKMNGTITVESKLNHGSKFTLRLQ